MKEKRSRRKLDNRGLSLVEVVIAMVILTAAVVPTLRTFSTATGFNSKARRNMQSITVAESVMEAFKGYDMEAMCRQFGADGNEYCAACGKKRADCDALHTWGTVDPVTGLKHETAKFKMPYHSVSVTADTLPTGESIFDSHNLLNENANDYVFTINECEEENRKYNVKVKVKKNAAYDDSVVKAELMNAYTDAVIKIGEDKIDDAYTELTTYASTLAANYFSSSAPTGYKADSYSIDKVEIKSLTRKITVTASGNTAECQLVYDYKMDIHCKYLKGSAGAGAVSTYTPESLTIPNLTGSITIDMDETTPGVVDNKLYTTQETLENIYFYYYPLYQNTTVGLLEAADEIEFVNSSGNLVGVHVARQKSTRYSGVQLNTYEGRYKVAIKGTLSGVGSDMTLEHNKIYKSLFNGTSNILECKVEGFGNKYDSDLKVEGAAYEKATLKNKALLYDVDVLVFNSTDDMSDEGTAIAKFSGTMNE